MWSVQRSATKHPAAKQSSKLLHSYFAENQRTKQVLNTRSHALGQETSPLVRYEEEWPHSEIARAATVS